jgi:hypothetical protein
MSAYNTASSRSTIGRELLIALLLAFYTFFGEFLIWGAGVGIKQIFLSSIALLYILSFLWVRREQEGSVVLFLGAVGVFFTAMLFGTVFVEFIVVLAATISLLRILTMHRSLVAAVADAGLTVASLLAGTLGYLVSGEFSAAVWSFFLIQAAYPLIDPIAEFVAGLLGAYVAVPSGLFPRRACDLVGAEFQSANPALAEVDRFKKAQRAAQEALNLMETR